MVWWWWWRGSPVKQTKPAPSGSMGVAGLNGAYSSRWALAPLIVAVAQWQGTRALSHTPLAWAASASAVDFGRETNLKDLPTWPFALHLLPIPKTRCHASDFCAFLI